MRTELWSQLAPYRRQHPALRWLEPASWHLTLLFLGAVHVDRISELIRLVDQVAQAHTSFGASIDGGGGRVHRQGGGRVHRQGGGRVHRQEGVAWLTIGEGAGEVITMADRLLEACPADVTTAAPPRRTPSAHLTVARRADRDIVEALAGQRYGRLAASWSAGRLALVRSHLGRGGARYETQHEATLYAADVRAGRPDG